MGITQNGRKSRTTGGLMTTCIRICNASYNISEAALCHRGYQ